MTSTDPGKEPQGFRQEWICRFRERGFCGKWSHSGISAPQGSDHRQAGPLGAREVQNRISSTPPPSDPSPLLLLRRKHLTLSVMPPAKLSPALNSVQQRPDASTPPSNPNTRRDQGQSGVMLMGCQASDQIQGRKDLLSAGIWGPKGGKGQGVTSRQGRLEAGTRKIRCSFHSSSDPPGSPTSK